MSPELAKKIMDMPEGKEIVEFIASEVFKLDTVDNDWFINYSEPMEISIEVKARLRAIEVLKKILDPLLLAKDYGIIKGSGNKDFIV